MQDILHQLIVAGGWFIPLQSRGLIEFPTGARFLQPKIFEITSQLLNIIPIDYRISKQWISHMEDMLLRLQQIDIDPGHCSVLTSHGQVAVAPGGLGQIFQIACRPSKSLRVSGQ